MFHVSFNRVLNCYQWSVMVVYTGQKIFEQDVDYYEIFRNHSSFSPLLCIAEVSKTNLIDSSYMIFVCDCVSLLFFFFYPHLENGDMEINVDVRKYFIWEVLWHISLCLTFICSVATYSMLDCSDCINPALRIAKYHINPFLG